MKLEDLNSSVILQLCRKLEEKGTIETASRIKDIIGQVFNYAIATSRATINPTLALKGALQSRKVKHFATITEPAKIAILMQKIKNYPFDILRCALKFSALIFCRPGEVRQAEWSEIDWQKKEWRVPREKMKGGKKEETKIKEPHIVPLANQTIEVLNELHKYTGKGKWLFPSARGDGRCMSENAVRVALRSMGITNEEMCPHGFRAMASTSLNNARRADGLHMWSVDAIELQLAHTEKNKVRGAYNRAECLPEREEMMQWYADWLDNLNKEAINQQLEEK